MDENILKQIETLNPWFYDLTINQTKVTPGIGSPHTPQQLIADTQYKRRILVESIVDKYDFYGKRLLDVASNCGYWSSYYAQHGAASLLAVEGREQFVQQGELYWKHDKALRDCHYKFLLGDVNDVDTWEKIEKNVPFDFTLCCGILYHITEHRQLLERIISVTKEMILIDTRVSLPDDPKTKPFKEGGNWKFDGIHTNGEPAMAAHPTLKSIINFFEERNFNVERIRALQPVHPLMAQNDNYDLDRRITLLCRKK